jgi:hypothetical protein
MAQPGPDRIYSGFAMKAYIASLLIPAILSMSAAQAADAVQWTDLPKTIGHGKMRSDNREDRDYRVVTKAGVTHSGHQLFFSSRAVSLMPSGASVPREQVAEIRIHRDARLSDALVAPGGKVLDSDLCGGGGGYCFPMIDPLLLLLIPVAAGAIALTAPFILPIEGIKRLLPDRVIKVAQ